MGRLVKPARPRVCVSRSYPVLLPRSPSDQLRAHVRGSLGRINVRTERSHSLVRLGVVACLGCRDRPGARLLREGDRSTGRRREPKRGRELRRSGARRRQRARREQGGVERRRAGGFRRTGGTDSSSARAQPTSTSATTPGTSWCHDDPLPTRAGCCDTSATVHASAVSWTSSEKTTKELARMTARMTVRALLGLATANAVVIVPGSCLLWGVRGLR